jgi:hypothetical protein
MTAFLLSLARVGGVLLLGGTAGWGIAAALFPAGARLRAERLGWSFAVGCALIATLVLPAPVTILAAGWPAFLIRAAILLAVARLLRLPPDDRPAVAGKSSPALGLIVVIGVGLYVLRALTEPMWSNDFIAIWGFKGKSLFSGGPLSPGPEFSHPEYPLGLPYLYAGLAFLTGRWDDHAMALLFPLFQVATLCVLFGWLRRRGASPALAALAAAAVAGFEPLYSAFLTGMAEVPLAFGLLLFGTALVDTLDETDPGATRRLAFASFFIAATKNEGLFLAVAASFLALAVERGRRWRVALAVLLPALLLRALHIPWRSGLPLSYFEWNLFSMERVWDSFAAAGVLLGWTTWAGLALLLALVVLGDRVPFGDRLLVLAVCALAAYLVIPAIAVRGPAWIIQTTLLRTTAALAPLVAAAVAVRYSAREPRPA